MKKILCLIALLSGTIGNAQEIKKKVNVEAANASYFKLPREAIFLHLNKSTYILGENIWFKGYIYDRKQGKPFKETANVYVGLYDEKGTQIQKNLYRGIKGYTQGNIAIDSTIASGNYYIKASTNWMKNFSEDDAFVQKIQIINTKIVLPKNKTVKYDLQLLPEGGHLISDIENTVGVKLIDNNGQSNTFKEGYLLDQNDKILLNFKGNSFGMGRFTFTPKTDQTYHVRLALKNDKEIKSSISKINNKGIALHIDNHAKDSILIALKTNKQTLKSIGDKKYTLLISKDGVSTGSFFTFSKRKQEILIPINRKDLYKGINTVTVFDANNKPLLERLFFNDYGIDFPKTSITTITKEKDSLNVSIKVFSELKSIKNLSVSVLPEATRAHNLKENTFSTFHLKPYIKGYIENPAYYFTNVNRRKLFDLDLLLLTQGWSRYEWNNVFYNTPEKVYEFQNGITVKGKFNEARLHRFGALLIGKSKNHTTSIVELDNSPEFQLKERFYEKGEKIELKLVRKRGVTVIPKLYSWTTPNIISDQINVSNLNLTNITREAFPDLEYKVEDKTIVLDEVEVQKTVRRYVSPDISFKNDIVIDNNIAIKFPFLSDLLRRKGFRTIESFGGISITSRRGGVQTPTIYFNDTRVSNEDINFLAFLSTNEIERIVINQNSVLNRGLGGTINIWTRKSPLQLGGEIDSREKIHINTEHAFSTSKKFYTPSYIYNDPRFEYTGVIHWEPSLITNDNNTISFKMIDTGLKNITFHIEGMGEDGTLISTKKNVTIDKQNL